MLKYDGPVDVRFIATRRIMTKRNQISIDQKVWLCDRKKSHKESHDVLSREFDRHFKVDLKLTKSTISGIVLQADKWRVVYESEAS